MKEKISTNLLIKYIYSETTVSESLAIEDALRSDWSLHEAYEEVLTAYHQLPKAKFNPSPDAIQNILKYSAQTAVEPQH